MIAEPSSPPQPDTVEQVVESDEKEIDFSFKQLRKIALGDDITQLKFNKGDKLSLLCSSKLYGLVFIAKTNGFITFQAHSLVKCHEANYTLPLNPIVRGLGKTMFNYRPFLFQQDGAPAHTAKVNQEWLRKNIPDFISKEEWPPSSPDLNPMDFSLWSILETNACSTPHKSIESLKTSSSQEWAKIPQEKLRAAVEAALNG